MQLLSPDKKYQRHGYGKTALLQLFEHLRTKPSLKVVVTSYHPGKGDPSRFYKKVGFIEVATLEKWGELGEKIAEQGELELEFDLG